jgi:hypothetical protein
MVVFYFLPLRSALEFGDDEGYEVIKGLMCNKGYHLYTDIWNDQPPIATFVLAAAFHVFGTTILTARLVAVCFALLMIVCFYCLILRRSGARCAILGTILFAAAPGTLVLFVSVMLECPAFATALLAYCIGCRQGTNRKHVSLLFSGIVLGIALQIKLTAALVVPAIAIDLFLCTGKRIRIREIFPSCAVWGAGLAGTFLLIGLTLGRGSLISSWTSHTHTQAVQGLDMPGDHTFQFRLLWNHAECWLAAGAGICIAVYRERLREIAFPLVLLTTVSIVHGFHRPWWNYYYLHFAVPLAWLAGWFLNDLIYRLQLRAKNTTWGLFSPATGILCLLIAVVLAKSERRMEGSIKHLRGRPLVETNPIVRRMKMEATKTDWVYSESGIYAFHAGLKVIPELAVIMPKRFWSGQISNEAIINTCRRYKPTLFVVRSSSISQDLREYLNSDYNCAVADQSSQLYVHK